MPDNRFLAKPKEFTAGVDNPLLSVEDNDSTRMIDSAGYLHLVTGPGLAVEPRDMPNRNHQTSNEYDQEGNAEDVIKVFHHGSQTN